jgi:peptidoglycan/LPS O-acetylase OafA/YrhL
VYTYTAWVQDNKIPVAQGWPVALATLVFCVLLAWICLRFYDVPVRRWLTSRFMTRARAGVVAGAAVPE